MEGLDVSRSHDALVQAGLILSSELSLPAVLQKIVDLACEVADARYGALGVLDPAHTGIQEFITAGVTEQERRSIGSTPKGLGLLGVLIREARPLRLRRIQDDPRSAGFPPNHPRMTSFLGVPVTVRGTVFGNLYLAEKRGAPEFTDEDERAVGVLAVQAGVAIENARLYKEARRQQRRLQALNEVTAAILGRHETDDVLRLIAHQARELVEADVATIASPEGGDRLILRVADGAHADRLLGMRFPIEDTISGEVMRTRSSLAVDDASLDPRVHQPIVQLGEIGPALFVPLMAGERIFGTLMIGNLGGGRAFTDGDLAVVELFARQAAVTLEYARLHDELQRLAVLEDRERIAKELHDGVVQSLFALGMSLQATQAVAGADSLQQRLASAVDDIDVVIRDLRNYIFGLQPGEIVDWHLERSLRDLAESYRDKTQIPVDVEIDAQVCALLAGWSPDIVQATREALSNAVRHAHATRITLSLCRAHGNAVLTIADDGAGFDPARVRGRGRGLSNLRARAETIGGVLEIDSTPNGGTRIRMRIPL